jgi:hypothetical protein
MTSLAEAESGAKIDCPKEIGIAIKALAADPTHKRAWDFIVTILCGTDRLAFALPDESPAIMGWRQGRRCVGLARRDIAASPFPDATPPPPPARTMTERARRRNTTTAQG